MKRTIMTLLLLIRIAVALVAETWIGIPIGNVTIPESVYPKMIIIPETTFRMGTDRPLQELNATPASTVSLSTFRMAETLPTMKLWRLFLQDTGYTGYVEEDSYWGSLQDMIVDEESPLINISWKEAIVFCNWLSIKQGLTPAYEISGNLNPVTRGGIKAIWKRGVNGYRLATEAEWEYVMFEGKSREQVIAMYSEWFNRRQPKKVPAATVGYRTSFGVLAYPNSKMREWVWDEYEPFDGKPKINPVGKSGLSSEGKKKVNRFFRNEIIYYRMYNEPETKYPDDMYAYFTIRLAQDIPGNEVQSQK